jgi:hypothetical protein
VEEMKPAAVLRRFLNENHDCCRAGRFERNYNVQLTLRSNSKNIEQHPTNHCQ